MAQAVADLRFLLSGTRCPACLRKIDAKVALIKGLHKSHLDFSTKSLVVDPQDLTKLPLIEKAIRGLGFGLIPENDLTLTHVLRSQQKNQIKRLGVAGAMVGNIMLFVVPVYAGLAGDLKQAFLWISFFMFLPVLFYSADSILKGGWSDLRSKTLSVDVLISFAALTTTLISLIQLVRGSDHVYFDSTASFLFLILVTRYLMDESREQLLRPLFTEDLLPDSKFQLSSGAEIRKEDIQPTDQFILKQNQWLPVDAVLKSTSGSFSSSYIDGEAYPKVFGMNHPLRSGLKLVQGQVLVQATSRVLDSQFSKFLQSLNQGHLNLSSSIKSADRLATLLMSVVTVTAVLVFLSGFWIGFEQSIQRSLALLVIACPCALAFAAPVTVGSFLRKSLLKGIFIKDAGVFEKLAKAQNFFFDKTGTLTDLKMNLKSVYPAVLDVELQEIILGLESQSQHPVAFAFRASWPNVQPNQNLLNLHETPGAGVIADFGPHHYELKRFDESQHADDYAVGLYRDTQLIAEFHFENHLRPQSLAVIEALKKSGKQVFLLSGDRRERVQQVAHQLGIPSDHCFSEVFPEDKAKVVSQFSRAVMIGDGINDALAFKACDVGVSVLGEIDAHANVAQVSIAGSGVGQVLELLNFADRCKRTLQRNYRLALIYNFVGGALAILGFVNPLAAAVAMPLSSSLLLLSTYWGVR